MRRVTQHLQNRPYRRWRIILALLLLFFLAARSATWITINRSNDHTTNSSFDSAVDASLDRLQDQLEVYADTLYSTRSLFSVDQSVSRQDWTSFVEAQNIGQRYPGIHTISYVTVISKSQTAELAAKLNANRLPSEKDSVSVYPASALSRRAIVTYVAPSNVSQQAIGYDLFTSQKRTQALNAARDQGTPRATLPLAPVMGPQQKGPSGQSMLMAMPVYRPSASLSTVSQRRAALQGYVVIGLQLKPLLDATLGADNSSSLAIKVSADGQTIYAKGTAAVGQRLQRTATVDVAGQSWQLTFSTPSDFGLSTTAKYAQTVLLVSSIPFAIMLGVAFYYAIRWDSLRQNHQNANGRELDKKKS